MSSMNIIGVTNNNLSMAEDLGGVVRVSVGGQAGFSGDVNAPTQMQRVKEPPLSVLTADPFYILMAAFLQRQAHAAVLGELH